MKVKATLWQKIKIFYYLMKHYEFLAIEKCQYCNSMHIKVSNKKTNDHSYTAKYTCLKCGASANVIESWDGNSEYRNGAITSKQEDAF